MRLGAMLIDSDIGNDGAFLRDMAQSVEGAGFDGVLTNDHVVGGHPDRQRPGEKLHTYDVPCHEPLVFLSFVGAVTTRLELATSIVISTQRQTVLLAKQAAELDLLTGGRLRLGVGIGRNWMEYEALEQDFSNRGRRLEEQVAVLRQLWTQELVTFDGNWHHLDRIGINPLPVQRPIPIWMGSFVGNIVEKVLERTGRLADGWMPQFPPGEQLASALERLRGYAAGAGRDPASLGIECGMRIGADDDPQSWVDKATAFEALGATHLRVSTMGGGYSTPDEHLAAWIKWHQAVRPELDR
ncbi:MAG: LLM class F420-dependent oxidoreductase [Ilumatobacteraceae bacterium]